MQSVPCRWMLPWLVLVLSALPWPLAAQQGSSSLDPELRSRLREANRNLVTYVRSELARPEARPHDVSARAGLLAHEPDEIFAFVRDDIRFTPYPGLQRGPAGVLVSGAGNAADQAFLLRELLRAGGYEARMVGATLTDEQVRQMLAAAAERILHAAPSTPPLPFGRANVDGERLRAICQLTGLSAPELTRLIETMHRDEDSEWTSALALTAREAKFLEDTIAAAGLSPAEPPLRAELANATRAHYWVQYKPSPTSPWTDLDPSFPGLGANAACTPPDHVDVDPMALGDRFQLSFQLERQVGDKRETVVILERSVSVPELLARPLRFEIDPTPDKLPVLDENVTEDGFYEMLSSLDEFQGRLTVGGEAFGSMVFDYDGQVSKVMANGRIKAAGDLGGAVAGGLGGAFGGGKKEEKEKSTLLSLWIDVGLLRGDETIWTQRRVILPEGERASWCPMLDWRFFFQTHEISRPWVTFARLSRRLKSDAFLERMMDWEESGDPADLRRAMATPSCYYPIDLLELCRARQAFLHSVGNEPAPGRMLYFDKSNVFVLGSGVRIDVAAKLVVRTGSIDIMENGALVLDGAADFSLDREATRALGTFDTVLERVLLRRRGGADSSFGTVEYFERARILGREPRLVSAHDEAALSKAGVPATDARWITAHATPDAYVLVAAEQEGSPPGPHAWWALDLASGRTLGRCSGGGGQDTVEELLTQLNSISNVLCVWDFLKPGDSMEGHLASMVWCSNSGRVTKFIFGMGKYWGILAVAISYGSAVYTSYDIASTAAGQ